MNKLTYTSSSALGPHTRNLPKPTEDFALIDKEHGIYLILDGITRVHAEYENQPYKSAACEVNSIFSYAVHSYLLENSDEPDAEKLLRDAVIHGNDKIREFRSSRTLEQWGFYPGTLGIIGLIRSDRFSYVCAGDCLGMLIRGNSKIQFGYQPAIQAVDLHKPSKKERYALYCNHPEHALCYGIFNGDMTVPETIEYSFLDLCSGDTLLLASDGISKYLQYQKASVLASETAKDMVAHAGIYDVPPFSAYGDDKGIIKIQIR